MGTLWRTTAAGLEAWRLTTAAAILAATTVDEIEAAVVGLA
jgi:hypothetical protein